MATTSSTGGQDQTEPQPIDLTESIITLSNGIVVRTYRHSDAPFISRRADNVKIARNMTTRWPTPYTVDKAHDWIAMTRNPDNWVAIGPTDPKSNNTAGLGPKRPKSFAITMNDEVMGGIGLILEGSGITARTAEFGYWIAEEFWGKGIMSQLVPAWVDWVWKTYPWIVKLQPSAYGWNPASGRVLEKAGFQLEGTLRCSIERYGVLGDLKVYGMIREGYKASNEPPVPK